LNPLRGARAAAGASILLASLAALAYWVLSRRPCESETAAEESLRALNYAQTEYEQTHPESGYAVSRFLGRCPSFSTDQSGAITRRSRQ
jgi:hypothetical protein